MLYCNEKFRLRAIYQGCGEVDWAPSLLHIRFNSKEIKKCYLSNSVCTLYFYQKIAIEVTQNISYGFSKILLILVVAAIIGCILVTVQRTLSFSELRKYNS